MLVLRWNPLYHTAEVCRFNHYALFSLGIGPLLA
jgi:hypothetical protein